MQKQESSTEELFIEIELELSRDDGQTLTAILDDSPVLPNLTGYYEILYDEKRAGSENTSLILYFPQTETVATLNLELLLSALSIETYQLNQKSIQKKDYLEAYKEYYKPFSISDRLVIVPSWDKGTAREAELLIENRIPLYLDPGLAFGTGMHPTTRLCLQYLDSHIRGGEKIIDAGCGSGILAIGALILGAREVYAFDIDGNAVTAVRQNQQLNVDRAENIILEQGGFSLTGYLQYEADLFIGNLTRNILFYNREYINKGKFNHMILSGILAERSDEVAEEFSPHWDLISSGKDDGWSLLEMVRKKQSATN